MFNAPFISGAYESLSLALWRCELKRMLTRFSEKRFFMELVCVCSIAICGTRPSMLPCSVILSCMWDAPCIEWADTAWHVCVFKYMYIYIFHVCMYFCCHNYVAMLFARQQRWRTHLEYLISFIWFYCAVCSLFSILQKLHLLLLHIDILYCKK